MSFNLSLFPPHPKHHVVLYRLAEDAEAKCQVADDLWKGPSKGIMTGKEAASIPWWYKDKSPSLLSRDNSDKDDDEDSGFTRERSIQTHGTSST
jgi:hypothetical protein